MNSEFKKDLINASQLKDSGNYKKALEIYKKQYELHSDRFSYNQKVDYAWTIIKVNKNLADSAIFIAEMLPQSDLNVKTSCPYTAAVFKVLINLKNSNNYTDMIPWLLKLNPVLLDDKSYESYGRFQKSRREKYYDWLSKAYFEDYQFDKCIEVSKKALNILSTFHDDGDVWFKWRIAKSLKELNKIHDALPYFKEVLEAKKEWYVYREIAEIYYRLNKPFIALDYMCPAILSKKPQNIKVNLYYLCYNIFKGFNPEMALKHAQMYYLIKSRNNYSIEYDIERLNINPDELNFKKLESEITDLWVQYRYKDHVKYDGVVVKFFTDKNFGFIRCENGRELFFHKNDVISNDIYAGVSVSFCLEEYFSKSKDKKSVKAVNVRVK